MKLANASVVRHENYTAGYRLLELNHPGIATSVLPGQFIHIKVPHLDSAVLRRPFSVFKANKENLSILYKEVGLGTRAMGDISVDDKVSVIGPLGNGFPEPDSAATTVLVAGGYGVAPLYMVAERSAKKGVLFVGGRSSRDILCVDEFTALGWEVIIATEDGSMGDRGLITESLDKWMSDSRSSPEFFVCGPDGLLKAIGDRAADLSCSAWLSLDKHMGCGVGACLACVQMIKENDGTVNTKRVCKDGPVFEAKSIMWK